MAPALAALEMLIMLWLPMGRWLMPNAFERPRFVALCACGMPACCPPGLSLGDAFSGLSMSMSLPASLLCRRWRFELVAERDSDDAPGPGAALGGADAIGTTPLPPTGPPDAPVLPWKPGGPLAVDVLAGPMLPGDVSAAGAFTRFALAGAVLFSLGLLFARDETAAVEFFLDADAEFAPEAVPLAAFFDLAPPPTLGPEPRLRFLMTSVFRLSGLTTPWSFRNRPQALQSGCPSGFRRHRGVV